MLIQFAELYKSGAMVETKEGKYAFDLNDPDIYDKFRDAAVNIIQIQMNGDLNKAKDLVDGAKSRLPENLSQNIVPQLESMPKDLRPYYSFKFGPSIEQWGYELMKSREKK